MKTSKKLQSGWTLKGKTGLNCTHSGNEHYFKKFTETNIFLIKLDYLYSVWVLLWSSNLKLNILLTRLGHS